MYDHPTTLTWLNELKRLFGSSRLSLRVRIDMNNTDIILTIFLVLISTKRDFIPDLTGFVSLWQSAAMICCFLVCC